MTMCGRVRCKDLFSAISKTGNSIRCKAAAALKEQGEKVREAAATGRNALGLDDDSGDSDADAQPASSARRHSPRGSCAEPKSAKIVSVSVQGEEVKVFLNGKTLWVECDSKCVKALCAEVAVHLVPEALRAARDAAPTGGPSARPAGSDKNIRIAIPQECLIVKYKDLDGNVKHYSKGLRIPTRTPFGEVVTAAAYQETMKRKIVEAKKIWNELDRSDRLRYVV